MMRSCSIATVRWRVCGEGMADGVLMAGVVYRGSERIEGSGAAVALLRRLGKRVLFLTNNR